MKKTTFLAGMLAVLTVTAFGQAPKAKKTTGIAPVSFTKYVDPYIGTGFHGHVFVGANVPFGAVQLGPTNLSEGWDWCSGYHISDSTIIGFQHTHLSGTGIGDLGDISFMPTTGAIKTYKGSLKDMQDGYVSLFSHKDEVVKPGYYKVKLKRYDIGVELTATTRVGMHKYTFPTSKDAHIVIDLQEGIGWDRSYETYIKQEDKYTISGYRFSKGWAADQRIYFTAVFSKPIEKFAVYDSTAKAIGTKLKGAKIKGVISFATSKGEVVYAKVGISPVSSANAMLNIKAEIPGWDFAKVVSQADQAWNAQLGKINIKADSLSILKKFYTAFYHSMVAPSIFNDVNGEYWGTDKKVHKNVGFNNVTTFSLWDTYRSNNPLSTIIHPEHTNDMINSMLAIYQQQGTLPTWHLMANETNCMVGYSAVPVVADALLKGYKGFDANLAYEAMKTTAMQDARGVKFVKKLGFIPADSTAESVSMGLEYAIDDWCLAQVAKKLGKTADYEYFSKRGKYYKNYYDPKAGFMRGRLADNSWRTPYSPFISIHETGDFTEGNGWEYTFLVPQDVEGLINLLGGKDKFNIKLDSLFIAEGDMGKFKSPDVSGLIGQYAHGNEPGHPMAYYYDYSGQPWKTAAKVRYILDDFYTTKTDGIIGNEDVGQMSAWYVLSALGFYPVNPANGLYVFGSPVITEATLKLQGNKTFHVVVKNNGPKNMYINAMKLNGVNYTKTYFSHKTLMAGGELEITMGDKPGTVWGVGDANKAVSVLK
ncbi:GH92 family glycosyl hydrolase [Mucilaginibacter ginsenosidivorax]|uniref:Glycoside hydrolase family 92 protein n=1 Tax=Mucilaginibacter ginsenosidivorax TaxID=862126 RepID=A0A5B8VSS6_9SPHI|nr:GH92 family glycosyl hydrolase [Mucilaginibacter ginsenosidivorax]QEC74490.1 glycoside hydrolase family 92 protein [Mucilaginibacter ginsenosidivorax]